MHLPRRDGRTSTCSVPRKTSNRRNAKPRPRRRNPAASGARRAGCRSRRCEIRRVVANPRRTLLGYADLRVGAIIGPAAALPAVILARVVPSGSAHSREIAVIALGPDMLAKTPISFAVFLGSAER